MLDISHPNLPTDSEGPTEVMQQLQSFIDATGPALRTVTKLDISITTEHRITSGTKKYTSSHAKRLEEERGQLIDETNTGMALALTSACPAVRSLRVDGKVRSPAIRVFGSLCPLLTALELSHTAMKAGEFETVNAQQLLPYLTKLDFTPAKQKSNIPNYATNCTRMLRVACGFSKITHLGLIEGMLSTGMEWMGISKSVTHLSCWALPRVPFPDGLKLTSLACLTTSSEFSVVSGAHLSWILAGLPCLTRLNGPHGHNINSFEITGPITHLDLLGLQQLSVQTTSMQLRLSGMHICANTQDLSGLTYEECHHVRPAMCELEDFPLTCITRCSLCSKLTKHGAKPSHTHALSLFHKVLPNVKSLELYGSWLIEDITCLQGTSTLQRVNLMHIEGFQILAPLIQLIGHNPSLHYVLLSNANGVITNKKKARASLTDYNNKSQTSNVCPKEWTAESTSKKDLFSQRTTKHTIRIQREACQRAQCCLEW